MFRKRPISRLRLAQAENMRLLEREAQLQLLMDASPSFISFIDSNQHYQFTNYMYEQWFGLSTELICGKHIRDILGPETYARSEPYLKRALSGEAVRFDTEIRSIDGARRHIDTQYVPFRDEKGEVIGAVIIGHDITDRKIAESDQRFLSELSTCYTKITDPEELIGTTTESLAKYLEATRCWLTEIHDSTATAVVSQDYARNLPTLKGAYRLKTFGPKLLASLREGKIIGVNDVKTDLRTAEHAQEHMALAMRSFITVPFMRKGRLAGAINVSSDSVRQWTEREKDLSRTVADTLWSAVENARLFQALQESETRLRTVVETAPLILWAVDSNGTCTMFEGKGLERLGLKSSDVVGKSIFEIYPNETTFHDHIKRALIGEEFGVDSSLGGMWFHSKFAPTRDSNDKITGLLAVSIEITDRIRMEEALKEAIQKRDDFISICSHELKTPVTSMKLQFEMASRQIIRGDERAYSRDAVARRAANAKKQLDRMANLIDDMLEVSKISSGRLELKREKIDLREICRDVVERFGEQVTILNIALTFDVPSYPIYIDGDRHRLEQVVINLVTNAIKYGAGKPINIKINKSDHSANLVVRDQGIGIPAEFIDKIFERFERAVSATNIGGLGLGLYISSEIVHNHGGKIKVESTPGKGSTFTVKLPLVE